MTVIEGILFVWLAWIYWVIATFLLKKSTVRTVISMTSLLCILVMDVYVSLYQLSLQVSLLLLALVGCSLIVRKSFFNKSKTFMLSIIVTMAYVSVLLFHLFDPIWFLINEMVVVSVLCPIIIMFLCKRCDIGVAAILIGIPIGEIIYTKIIFSTHNTIVQTSKAALDMLVVSISILFVVHGIIFFLTNLQKNAMKTSKRGRALL